MDAAVQQAYDYLKEVRKKQGKTLKRLPTSFLKDTFTDFDGSEKPLRVRDYQAIGVTHLLNMARFLLGDDTGTGKTLMVIIALCFLWEKKPKTKAIILANKSAVGQWAAEFPKFAHGITVFIGAGTPQKRQKIYQDFFDHEGPCAIVIGYRTIVRDIAIFQDLEGYVFISDEATAYCNPKTQVHQVCAHMSRRAKRSWALTATMIKNNLIEGFGIYKALIPGLFPSKSQFMREFCVTRMQKIPGSRKQIPIIVGYRKRDIIRFRDIIDPYFIGRAKHEVASELPVLTTREIRVTMGPAQQAKYMEALAGILYQDKTGEEKTASKLSSLVYCQEIVDHPALVDCEGGSTKIDRLVELLTEGDLRNEKVILFTRFRKLVDILAPEFEKKYQLKGIRITGKEKKVEERLEAIRKFQDPNSDAQLAWITTAGSESVNLQAAKAVVFIDTPWSGGDFLQTIGRMIRLGSVHERCYCFHMVCDRTIDDHVLKTLKKKMKLIESVIGRRVKGEDVDVEIKAEDDISELFRMMQQDAMKAAV